MDKAKASHKASRDLGEKSHLRKWLITQGNQLEGRHRVKHYPKIQTLEIAVRC